VVSARREHRVPATHALLLAHDRDRGRGNDAAPLVLDEDVLWVVGRGEADAYRRAGARRVVEGGSLCASRNRALDEAARARRLCVQLSDDLHELHERLPEAHRRYLGRAAAPLSTARGGYADWPLPALAAANALARRTPCVRRSPREAAAAVRAQMRAEGARLGGVYPLRNAGYAMQQRPATHRHFVVGDFMVIDPRTPCRFDPALALKEDYDYTAAHLREHGRVARCNRLFVVAEHRTNAGGAVDVRRADAAAEERAIATLRRKWGARAFAPHPRRAGEVVMRWPPAQPAPAAAPASSRTTTHKQPPPQAPTQARRSTCRTRRAAAGAGA
jgi:hypothetical protein